MKFVTVCEGGVVRSVSMALALKLRGQDAVALSLWWNTEETRNMLYAWADYVVLMQSKFIDQVPIEYHVKCRVVDVGPDSYHNPLNDILRGVVETKTAEWESLKWSI